MITIDQLLESVDLDFEPRWVTKDEDGDVWIWNTRPDKNANWCLKEGTPKPFRGRFISERLKLAEFEGKDWTECIYEVPRKATGDINKIKIMPCKGHTTALSLFDIALKVNEIIDQIETLEERTEDVCARIIEVERKVL